MSDGPYRTLKMRPHWKRVAQRAYQTAFDNQDVIESICPALERDWWWEVPNDFMKELRSVCARNAPALLGDELDRLKRVASGRGTLCVVLAQCIVDTLAQGKNGDEAVREAVKQTLHDRLVRNARQMEEHFLREGAQRRAAEVRFRIATAITRVIIDVLADKLVNQPASGKAVPPKHQGLDDGVGLR